MTIRNNSATLNGISQSIIDDKFGDRNGGQSRGCKGNRLNSMKLMGFSDRNPWKITAKNVVNGLLMATLVFVDSLTINVIQVAASNKITPISQPISQAPHTSSNQPIAQSVNVPIYTCPQVNNRRYVVLTDRPASFLPPLPQFLAIAAVPCSYLNTSMTFFGGFDNVKPAIYRASQMRELGLDAVIYSFSTKVSDIPANLQAAAVLVELNNDPNVVAQQVRSLTGKNAVVATFNNRTIILAAPLSSIQSANTIASLLRNQGIAAQAISADLIASPSSSINSNTQNSNQNSGSTASNSGSSPTIYRVLVPNASADTLKQVRAIAPDAFITIFKGKSYIQVSTYTNRANAHRGRDLLNSQFSGAILLQD
jgi:hypothetical protein